MLPVGPRDDTLLILLEESLVPAEAGALVEADAILAPDD
jgi:hypothetical protein